MDYIVPGIVTVVFVVMLFGYLITRMALRHEEKKLGLQATEAQGASDAVLRDHEAEIGKLRDRVAILERLLTDDDRRLANEISRLKSRDEVRG